MKTCYYFSLLTENLIKVTLSFGSVSEQKSKKKQNKKTSVEVYCAMFFLVYMQIKYGGVYSKAIGSDYAVWCGCGYHFSIF